MSRKHPVSHDYRLVPAAAAVWTTAVAGLFVSWQAAAITGLAAGAIGLIAWRRAWWTRTCAIALLISGPLAAAWIGGHVLRAESHPLRLAANEGRTTTLTVEQVVDMVWEEICPWMSKSWEYLCKHSPKLSQRYGGKYIVVLDDRIVAVGATQLEAYQKIAKPVPSSCEVGIYYIPSPKEPSAAL